jgi:hypothetical protein
MAAAQLAPLGNVFPGFGDTAGLELPGLSPRTEAQILKRLTSGDFEEWAAAAAKVGHCTNPIRMRGWSRTYEKNSGELLSTFSSEGLDRGVLHLRCGNRRADRCPSCSRQYAADMFHLIRCGVAGGKTVPATVGDNPLVFATLTAPSFGAVHSLRDGSQRCHPRSGARAHCPHGGRLSCTARHSENDDRLGQPLCWECYDYASHVVWQWWAPELWRRFTISLRRIVAKALGVGPRDLNDVATVQYAKVAEFQVRGVIHFHALIRLDGPRSDQGFEPAPEALDAPQLARLIETASRGVTFDAPPVLHEDTTRTLRFGEQVDARPVRASRRDDDPSQALRPEQVAGYLAKYSTKAATVSAGGGTNEHLERIRAVGAAIAEAALDDLSDGADGPYELMAHWVHMFCFRGHFATKSRRYSVTLGALRRARRRAQVLLAQARQEGRRIDLALLEAELMASEDEETTLVIGDWRYAGSGWETDGDVALARAAAARAREYDQWKAQRKSRGRGGKG